MRKASNVTVRGWLRERQVYAEAWLLSTLTTWASLALLGLMVVGVVVVRDAGTLLPFAGILPFLVVVERVRVDASGTTVTDYWTVIPWRRRRYPPGGFDLDDGFSGRDWTVVHDGAPVGDEGLGGHASSELVGWLNEQVARLQREGG